jgi:hypothetical protein
MFGTLYDPFNQKYVKDVCRRLQTAGERSTLMMSGTVAEASAYIEEMNDEIIRLMCKLSDATDEVKRLQDKFDALENAIV